MLPCQELADVAVPRVGPDVAVPRVGPDAPHAGGVFVRTQNTQYTQITQRQTQAQANADTRIVQCALDLRWQESVPRRLCIAVRVGATQANVFDARGCGIVARL